MKNGGDGRTSCSDDMSFSKMILFCLVCGDDREKDSIDENDTLKHVKKCDILRGMECLDVI